MHARLNHNTAMSTCLTIDATINIVELDKLLSSLISASHCGLYYIHTPTKIMVLITAQQLTHTYNLAYYNGLLAIILPGATVTNINTGLFSLKNFTPYTTFLGKILTNLQIGSSALADVLVSAIRSEDVIREINSQKLAAWEKANKPAPRVDRRDDFGGYSSMFNDFQRSNDPFKAHHHSHDSFGSNSGSMSHIEKMQRDSRAETDRINAETRYEFDLERMEADFNKSTLVSAESTLLAIKKLLVEVETGKMTEAEFLQCWPSFIAKADIPAPTTKSLISKKSHTDISIKIKGPFGIQRSRFIDYYYADVNAFFDELFSIINMGRLASKRLYNPNSCSEARLKIKGIVVAPENAVMFAFDLQRALLATGLLERFTLDILHHSDARKVFEKQVATLVTKYKLPDNSYASLEKCLRSTVVNNQLEDFQFLLDNIPLNIDAQDTNPARLYTALHYAVDLKRIQFIEPLLARHAKLDIVAANKATALSLGREDNQDADIKALFPEPSVTAVSVSTEKPAGSQFNRKM
jgi:hypothetical protein